MTPRQKTKVKSRRDGFTLIITISLLVLLTLIGIGMLSLSAVTLRSSSIVGAKRIARDNARMALMLAIGELQKQMGQDQRVSATANIAGTTAGDALADGAAPQNNNSINNLQKGLSSVQNGTRYWTGVFTNRDTVVQHYTRTPSPNLVQWLVSGNQGTSDIIPPNSPSNSNFSVSADGNVSDTTSAVVVVGKNTVNDPSHYVAAPMQPIQKENKLQGRYAWWVGDEGVKSLINQKENSMVNTNYASIQPMRRGWESVDGLANYPGSGNTEQLEKITTLDQLELIVGTGDEVKDVFHSATAHSAGVIVDTVNGGTRIDLSNIMTGSLPATVPAGMATITNYPVRGGKIIPRTVARSMEAPRWDEMQDFFNRSTELSNGTLTVRGPETWTPRAVTLFPSTTAQANNRLGYRRTAIAPLIVDFRMLFGIRFRMDGTQYKANSCGKIAIALANPYSTPLKWDSDLVVEVIDTTPGTNSGYKPARIWQLVDNTVFIDRSRPAAFNNVQFRIPSGSLNPGEARAYSVASPVLRAPGSLATVSVPMAPVNISLRDFRACIEQDSTGKFDLPASGATVAYDVRESWQTTSATVELRLGGSTSGGTSNLLRRLERLELDNGYFGPNTRRFTSSEIQGNASVGPVPMMLYKFQISQPGVDYVSVLPGGYEIGQRGSTLRTFTDFNLQAVEFSKPIACYNPPPYFMQSNNSFAALGGNLANGDTGEEFSRNISLNPVPWGRAQNGNTKTVLFTVPRQIISLGQLQHADLTGDDTGSSIGHQSGYAFGNSYATPFVQRRSVIQARTDYELTGASSGGAISASRNYYDISHLLNTAIWDSYFLSTIDPITRSEPQNPILKKISAETQIENNPTDAAAKLMIQGAFNVNSTDKNAWKALLASTRFYSHPSDSAQNAQAAFPRSLEQIDRSSTPPTGTAVDSYSGYRRLSDNELEQLSQEIVRQVRTRGPFLSLSHFINRSLADVSRPQSRSGALQMALDESGCNINFAKNKKAFSQLNPTIDQMSVPEKNGAPRADLDGGDTDGHPGGSDWAVTSTDNNYGTVGSIYADRVMLNRSKSEQGYRSTGIPGWINQADVLQVIGSSLSARSDTFRIRAYGEAVNPDGSVASRAWCEAIVQRMPEYIDPIDQPTARGTTLSNLNKVYGRKFHIASFRWLHENEI